MPTNNDSPPPSGLPSVQVNGRAFYGIIARGILTPPTEAELNEEKERMEEGMRARGFVKMPLIITIHDDGSEFECGPIMQFKD